MVGIVKARVPVREATDLSEYIFQEFPKWVKNENGDDILVENADEERAVTKPATKSEPALDADLDETPTRRSRSRN